jgi:transposase
MEQPTVRKTYKYKLQPTPTQERTLAFVVRRCRELYNAGLQERRDAWQKCRVSVRAGQQSAELPVIKAVRPEYHDVHSQVLQDVLTRLDQAFAAFFRRVLAGETPGYPRFQGARRYHSFTYKQVGNGATLQDGFLVLSKIGWIAVRWRQFRTILEGKAAYAGRQVIAAPPAYTSQDCSGCGERVEKSLSIRTHICASCGVVLDRDENAARNIQRAGQARQGAATVVAVLN